MSLKTRESLLAIGAASAVALTGCAEQPEYSPQEVDQLNTILGGVAVELAAQAIAFNNNGEYRSSVIDDRDSDDPVDVVIAGYFLSDDPSRLGNSFSVSLREVDGILDPSTVTEVRIDDGNCVRNPDTESDDICVEGSTTDNITILAPGQHIDYSTIVEPESIDGVWSAENFVDYDRGEGDTSGAIFNTYDRFYTESFQDDGSAVETAQYIADKVLLNFANVTRP